MLYKTQIKCDECGNLYSGEELKIKKKNICDECKGIKPKEKLEVEEKIEVLNDIKEFDIISENPLKVKEIKKYKSKKKCHFCGKEDFSEFFRRMTIFKFEPCSYGNKIGFSIVACVDCLKQKGFDLNV